MRMYLRGFSRPIVLRFGSLDLVKGEWRTYDQPLDGVASSSGKMAVSSFNIENKINNYRNQLKSQNINDVNNHLYTYAIGTMYMDIIQECEKLGDYVVNVVEARMGVRPPDAVPHFGLLPKPFGGWQGFLPRLRYCQGRYCR